MYMLLEKLKICNKNILLPGISNKQPELENFSTVTIILTLTIDQFVTPGIYYRKLINLHACILYCNTNISKYRWRD